MKAIGISLAGRLPMFDGFEYAMQALAHTCAHCGCRILGHDLEAHGGLYCCAHCASQQEVTAVQARV
jgi:Rieske Fe-S protein